jgi:SagB-type dehydrogenase family enzyme
MTILRMLVPTVGILVLAAGSLNCSAAPSAIKLPPPVFKGQVSVEAAIKARKSARSFRRGPLTLQQVSQILWAANGVLPTDAVTGATRRVTPSAGGLYPIEAFVLTGKGSVTGAPAGVYRYDYASNSLKTVVAEDRRSLLAGAALSQTWLARAPVVVLLAGVFARTTGKYGSRGVNYVFMEAGNADQNLCLQAEALGLRSATVGAFVDSQVSKVLKLPAGVSPLLIIAVGK